MFWKLSAALTVSSVAGAAAAIAASTAGPDDRPWWQVMQRASPPSPSTVTPEGKVTDDSASAAGLWQVTQRITDLVGAGLSTTPAALPSPPM
jgi:hypothetical protein